MTRMRIGEFVVDPDSNAVVSPDGGDARLEPKVMAVLCALAKRPGEVVTRDQLIDEIWGVEHGADERLTRAVSILRKVFNGTGGEPCYIETIPKRGYKLVVPVRGIEAPHGGAPDSNFSPEGKPAGRTGQDETASWAPGVEGRYFHPDTEESGETGESASAAQPVAMSFWTARTGRIILSRMGLLAGFAAGILIVLVAGFLLIGGGKSGQLGGVTRNLLAVDTFQVIGNDQEKTELRTFADSLRTNIVSFMSNRDIKVITSGGPPPEARPEFQLLGTVEKEADKYRVTATLRETGSELALWSRSYTRASKEAVDFREEIATKITLVIRDAFGYRKNEPDMSNRGFQAYLRYIDLGLHRYEILDANPYVDYAYAAFKANPDSTQAKALYAYILSVDAQGTDQARNLAIDNLASEVLKIDADNLEARVALAILSSKKGDWAKAEQQYEKAMKGERQMVRRATNYAVFLAQLGRIEQAIDQLKNEVNQDSLALVPRISLAWLLGMAHGEIGRAEFEFARSLRIYPHQKWLHLYRFQVHLYAGDPARALAYVQDENTEQLRLEHKQRKCFATFARTRMSASPDTAAVVAACRHSDAIDRMKMFTILGDLDRAYAAAQKSEGLEIWSRIFGIRKMRPFRRDPRFWPLAHKWGLVDYWLETDKWPDFCREKDLHFDCKERALAVREGEQEARR